MAQLTEIGVKVTGANEVDKLASSLQKLQSTLATTLNAMGKGGKISLPSFSSSEVNNVAKLQKQVKSLSSEVKTLKTALSSMKSTTNNPFSSLVDGAKDAENSLENLEKRLSSMSRSERGNFFDSQFKNLSKNLRQLAQDVSKESQVAKHALDDLADYTETFDRRLQKHANNSGLLPQTERGNTQYNVDGIRNLASSLEGVFSDIKLPDELQASIQHNLASFRQLSTSAKAFSNDLSRINVSNLQKLASFVNNMNTQLRESTSQLKQMASSALNIGIKAPASNFYGAYLTGFRTINNAWNSLRNTMQTAIRLASPVISPVTNGLRTIHNTFTSTFRNIGTTIGSYVRRGISSVMQDVQEMGDSMNVYGAQMRALYGNTEDTTQLIQKTSKQLASYGVSTVYDTGQLLGFDATIRALAPQLDSVNFVKGLGGLAAQTANPNQSIAAIMKQLQDGLQAGKLRYADARIAMQWMNPLAASKINKQLTEKAANAGYDSIQEAMTKGAITLSDFLKLVETVGNSPEVQALAEYIETPRQAMANLKETISRLAMGTIGEEGPLKEFYDRLTKSIMGISNWLSADDFKNGLKVVNGVGVVLNRMLDGVDRTISTIQRKAEEYNLGEKAKQFVDKFDRTFNNDLVSAYGSAGQIMDAIGKINYTRLGESLGSTFGNVAEEIGEIITHYIEFGGRLGTLKRGDGKYASQGIADLFAIYDEIVQAVMNFTTTGGSKSVASRFSTIVSDIREILRTVNDLNIPEFAGKIASSGLKYLSDGLKEVNELLKQIPDMDFSKEIKNVTKIAREISTLFTDVSKIFGEIAVDTFNNVGWKNITQGIKKFANNIRTMFEELQPIYTELATGLLTSFNSRAFDNMVKQLADVVVAMAEGVNTVLRYIGLGSTSKGLEKIYNFISDVANFVEGTIKVLSPLFGAIGSALINTKIASLLGGVMAITSVVKALGGILEPLATATTFASGIKSQGFWGSLNSVNENLANGKYGGGFFDTMSNAFNAGVSTFQGAVANFSSAVNSFLSKQLNNNLASDVVSSYDPRYASGVRTGTGVAITSTRTLSDLNDELALIGEVTPKSNKALQQYLSTTAKEISYNQKRYLQSQSRITGAASTQTYRGVLDPMVNYAIADAINKGNYSSSAKKQLGLLANDTVDSAITLNKEILDEAGNVIGIETGRTIKSAQAKAKLNLKGKITSVYNTVMPAIQAGLITKMVGEAGTSVATAISGGMFANTEQTKVSDIGTKVNSIGSVLTNTLAGVIGGGMLGPWGAVAGGIAGALYGTWDAYNNYNNAVVKAEENKKALVENATNLIENSVKGALANLSNTIATIKQEEMRVASTSEGSTMQRLRETVKEAFGADSTIAKALETRTLAEVRETTLSLQTALQEGTNTKAERAENLKQALISAGLAPENINDMLDDEIISYAEEAVKRLEEGIKTPRERNADAGAELLKKLEESGASANLINAVNEWIQENANLSVEEFIAGLNENFGEKTIQKSADNQSRFTELISKFSSDIQQKLAEATKDLTEKQFQELTETIDRVLSKGTVSDGDYTTLSKYLNDDELRSVITKALEENYPKVYEKIKDKLNKLTTEDLRKLVTWVTNNIDKFDVDGDGKLDTSENDAFMTALKSSFEELRKNYVTKVGETLKKWGKWFGNIFGGGKVEADETDYSKQESGKSDAGSELSINLDEELAKVSEKLNQIKQRINDEIKSIVKSFDALVGEDGAWSEGAINSSGEGADAFNLTESIQKVQEGLAQIKQHIQDEIQTITESFEGLVGEEGAWTSGTETGGGAGGEDEFILTEAIQKVQEGLQAIKDHIQQEIQSMVDSFDSLVGEEGAWVESSGGDGEELPLAELITQLQEKLQAVIDGVTQKIQELVTAIGETGTAGMEAILIEPVTTAIEELLTSMEEFVNAVAEKINEMKDAVNDGASQVGAVSISDITAAINNLVTALKGLVSKVASKINEMTAAVESANVNVDTSPITSATSGIGSALSSLVASVASAVNRIKSAISSAKASADAETPFRGGRIHPVYKASGGAIPIPTINWKKRSTDTVPAMLTPGEFVIRKQAVQEIGTNFLNRINRRGKDALRGMSVASTTGKSSVINNYYNNNAQVHQTNNNGAEYLNGMNNLDRLMRYV